ncbi:MAG: FAD-linked oxidase [Candidatus Aminicenantes bacterium]|nr:FAD-linked oxidase [Candidatus Aminicenantes bacterium]
MPPSALAYLAAALGPASPGPSEPLETIVRRIPASRLPENPLLVRDPETRLRRSRGHSLPDWIALRFGSLDRFPDGVALPASEEEVERILAFAKQTGTWLIPYGGGTSVVGHINPPPVDHPCLTVSLERMRRMSKLDESSRLAVFEAGVTGPHLEAQTRARGYTLGHFPQSFEYSTLGGWIATRSSGQQSLYYGRIEDLFAGGRMITPAGVLEMPPFPASAAGPDLRQAVLGSEGRLGIISSAIVRVSPLPRLERFHGIFFPSFDQGVAAVKEMVQSRLQLSMLRLSDSLETNTSLILTGNERMIRLLNGLLRVRGLKDRDEKCMLFLGITRARGLARKTRRIALDIVREHGGVHVGRKMGSEWRKSRFKTPYLRNTLWDIGYAVDTLETALTWANLPTAIEAVLKALRTGLEDKGEHVLAFGHVSHVYATGASIYVTFLFRIAANAGETLLRWQKLKEAASRAIVAHGGTISHQHGIGVDHQPWISAEKGRLGLQSLASLAKAFDPDGIMNPGKLLQTFSPE